MAEKVIIQLEVDSSNAEKDAKKVSKSVNELASGQGEYNELVKASGNNMQKAGAKSVGALRSVKTGLSAVGTAMKAMGIGLIIAAFAQLTEIMKSNQKVADFLATIMETVSLVFSQVTDAIISAYESVSEATGGFDALQKVIGGLLTIALAPLKMAFYGIKLGIQELMLAWEESVFGDGDTETIKKLNGEIYLTKLAIEDVAKGVVQAGQDIYDNIGEAISEVGAFGEAAIENVSKVSVAAAYEASKNIVELKNNAELAIARNKGLLEQYDQQAEKLRQIRDEERNSLSSRIEANQKLGELLDEQEKKMLENARLQVQLARYEVDKNNSVENRKALIEAENELIGIQAQIEGFRSEQKANDLALDRERIELQKTYTDAQVEAEKTIAQAKVDGIQNEVEKLDALEQLKIDQYNADVARINDRLNQLIESGQMETQAYADIAAEKIALEADFASEMIGIDTERAAKQKEIEKEKQASIAAMSMQGFQLIGQLAGEGSDLAKAMAVAQVTYETYNAVMSAFSSAAKNPLTSVFPAFPFIQAGLAGAFGAMQIKNLLADNGTGGGSAGGSAASAMVTPSVNLTSAANQNNALGNIAQNTSSPMRAYVVSKDVASAAAYERSRKTIGTL